MATSTATKGKLVLKMSVSLDGFVAGPNGELDWAFRTMGHPTAREWILSTLTKAGAHIVGSGAYDDLAAFWPYSDSPLAPAMNDIPKIIFSRKGIKDGTQADRVGGRPGVTPTAAVLQSWAEPMVALGSPKASLPPASLTNIDWSFIRLYWARANRCSAHCAVPLICA